MLASNGAIVRVDVDANGPDDLARVCFANAEQPDSVVANTVEQGVEAIAQREFDLDNLARGQQGLDQPPAVQEWADAAGPTVGLTLANVLFVMFVLPTLAFEPAPAAGSLQLVH